MVYSVDDVKRMLAQIREDIKPWTFFYKNDEIPPKVVFEGQILAAIKRVEDTL